MSSLQSDTCTIHVHRYKIDFTVMPNSIWENHNISWAAKGLLGYLVSRPDNWQIHTWQLIEIYEGNKNGGGQTAVRALINELKHAGYITYSKSKNAKGQWIHRYDVYPEPVTKDIQKKIPEVEVPPLEPAKLENPTIITNTELPNTELPNTPKGDKAQTASRQSYEFTFSFEKSKFEGIQQRDLDSWKELYPAVDVIQELKRMREWVISNSSKSKSKKKWRTFINNWLRKCNDTNINKEAYQGAKAPIREKNELGKTKIKFKSNGEMYEE